MKPSEKDLYERIVKIASDYAGLYETKQNQKWDDPKTAGEDKAKSDALLNLMRQTGWSPGDPYCAAFAGGVVISAALVLGLNPAKFKRSWTPHCMTNVRSFQEMGLLEQRSQPSNGALMLMRHGLSDSGHAGIVIRVDGIYPNRMLATVEGNTMPGMEGDQRQGDGIYIRARNVDKNGDLVTQGFLPIVAILGMMS